MILIPKITAALCLSWKKHETLSTFLSSNSYNSLSIDEKSIKNIKNDLEMTSNDLQMTLRPKTTAPPCLSRKKYQKLSISLSSNSYNSLAIDEKPVKNIKNDQK